MEGGFHVQREQARRQAFDAKLADAMLEVPEVAEADVLKLTEHRQQEEDARREHGTGASADLPGEAEETPAEGAGPRLDLLA